MDLVFGQGECERVVPNVEQLLATWHKDERDAGQLYLEYVPVTPRDRLVVEDLSVTLLISSQLRPQAATSVCRHGATLDFGSLPDKALEETSDDDRQILAELIGTIASWPYLGASTATKALHKKRPALIPILDNMAIFGAYMNPLWPENAAGAETVYAVTRIKEALDWITSDLTRSENEAVWMHLEEIDPERSRIELFDMVWWPYFSPRRSGA